MSDDPARRARLFHLMAQQRAADAAKAARQMDEQLRTSKEATEKANRLRGLMLSAPPGQLIAADLANRSALAMRIGAEISRQEDRSAAAADKAAMAMSAMLREEGRRRLCEDAASAARRDAANVALQRAEARLPSRPLRGAL